MLRWQIRRDGQAAWQPISVPGCWEDAGFPADDPGPYWYRTTLRLPREPAALRFGAVSYHCTVYLDGQRAGEHTGMWDAFQIDLPAGGSRGDTAELLVCVEKPASLTAGPDSPAVGGRFPLRQTLSGFLPYVWGHAFGGFWQAVSLVATGFRRLLDVQVRGSADGRVRLAGECSAPGPLTLAICDPGGALLVEEPLAAEPGFEWSGRLSDPLSWSPECPALYTVRLRLPEGDERCVRLGLRTLDARGATLRLNRQPIYPRLALSWGWAGGRRCPNPGPEWVRANLLGLRAMGYNGVKLCLWFPPPYYLDLADELGMILWFELPMWLPEPSPFFYHQTPLEVERLVRSAAVHPSVLFYTLGCELDRQVEAGFLADLYRRVKALAGDALVRDNSGSGEAYGGWPDESADFYDHHFYCDLQFLRPLLDAFAPAWRPEKPWLMGEFCDYDTLRDLPALLCAGGRQVPWWMQDDPRLNPQGARWEMRVASQVQALGNHPLLSPSGGRLDELVQASCRQGVLHRKVTLETVRARPELSGYVVTGEVDTPVSTAGMWDDLGRAKYDAEQFRAFHDDLVLLVGWDRRRAWVSGGDRPASWDPYSVWAGSTVRAHLLVSNYGSFRGRARLHWQAGFPGRRPLAGGEAAVRLGKQSQGRVQELMTAEFSAPDVGAGAGPRRIVLQAQIQAGARRWGNAWPMWVYPADPWAGVAPFELMDPQGVLADLARLAGELCRVCPPERPTSPDRVLVCTAGTPDLSGRVAAGGQAVLLQQKSGPRAPLPVVHCPYWREALKWVEPHAAWGDFPHECDPGLQFYGLATDCALDGSAAGAGMSPLLRRLDTRGLDVHEYAVVLPWDRGRAVVTTLRPQGGLGDQPTGLGRNPAGAHLLACWLRYLQAP